MSAIRVVLAEDQPQMRETLSALLRETDGLTLVGVAADARQAIRIAERERPDIAVIDVRMPGGGPAAAAGIRKASPRTAVLALTASEERAAVVAMLRAGASGYVVKGTSPAAVLDAIAAVARGEAPLSPRVTSAVVRELVEQLARAEDMAARVRDFDQAKSEMMQLLSHELLTPLTVISGTAQTLAQAGGKISAAEASELVDGVMRAADRMRRLVANLEAAARVRGAEDRPLDLRPQSVSDLISRAAADLPGRRERLRLPADEGWQVLADAELAVRALAAVLENALGLSPPTSPVEMHLVRRDPYVVVQVADRGGGIPPEVGSRVFEAFIQGDSTTTRSHQGLGIGLYLARLVMQAHHGHVETVTRAGGGTVAELSFLSAVPAGRPLRWRATGPDISVK